MSEKVLDRISEAYYGELTDLSKEKAKRRIDWMIENVKGENILDVGCSQGITSILLGKQGKNVIGIDAEDEQIKYANEDKKKQGLDKNVEFVCGDFSNYKFNKTFDTIVMGEILEHLFNPKLFIDRAVELLNEDGRLVITVPFGINPFPDHKRTFYFTELFKMVNEKIIVTDVMFFNGWLGLIADKNCKENQIDVDDYLLQRIEECFYYVDDTKQKRIDALKVKSEKIDIANAKVEDYKIKTQEANAKVSKYKSILNQIENERVKEQNAIEKNNQLLAKSNAMKKKLAMQLDQYNTLLYSEKKKNARYEKLPDVKLYHWLKKILKKNKKDSSLDDIYYSIQNEYNKDKIEKEKYCKDLIERAKKIPESNGSRYFNQFDLTIGIIADEFQLETWADCANTIYINPNNYKVNLDLLVVVSTWHGLNDDWGGLGRENDKTGIKDKLDEIIKFHKEKGVKVIFYSKEDPVNYYVFLNIAKKCDYIFTSDVDCIDKYIKDTGNKNVDEFAFAVNPMVHNPVGFEEYMEDEVIFAGTWGYGNKYPERNIDLEILFMGVIDSGKPLRIFDRNFYLDNEAYKYPFQYREYVYPSIKHSDLMKVHKLFKWALNINSIKYSDSMFASRVYELQACGSLILSNFSIGIKKLFKNVVICPFPATVCETFNSLSKMDEYKLQLEGIRKMFNSETIYHRLNYVLDKLDLKQYKIDLDKKVLVIVDDENDVKNIENFNRQLYPNKQLIGKDLLTEDILSKAYMFTYFDVDAYYGENYLQDMINGFKYTNTDFITKDSYYDKDQLVSGISHDYVHSISDKTRTVFWNNGYDLDSVVNYEFIDDGDDILGYSIDKLSYNNSYSYIKETK